MKHFSCPSISANTSKHAILLLEREITRLQIGLQTHSPESEIYTKEKDLIEELKLAKEEISSF